MLPLLLTRYIMGSIPVLAVLLAPLTGLEVRGSRVEGKTLVVECNLSINLNSLTIEQVAMPQPCPKSKPQTSR